MVAGEVMMPVESVAEDDVVKVSGTPKVRRFRPDDQVEAKALILEGLKEHFGEIRHDLNPDLRDLAASYLRDGEADFLVIELDGAVVATTGVLFERQAEARLVRVSVRKTLRRAGLSTLLLRAVEDLCRSRSIEVLWAETELDWADAIAFYTAMGFTERARNATGVRLRREVGPG